MARPGFLFGGDTGITPEMLKRNRAVMEALEAGASQTPRNVGEGIGAIGRALAYRVAQGRVEKGEKAQSERTAANWTTAGNWLSANGGGAGFSTATGPITSASPAPSGTASIPTGERASYIRSGLVQRGLPEHVADGFLANFQDESGLDPGINERNPIVPGSRGGFGLYQLTGPRRREYEAFASKRGVDPSDMDAQLDFMMGELQGSERAAAERIFAAKDTAGAAQAIVTNFLRPAAEHRNSRVAKYAGLGGGMQAQAQPEPVQVASLDPSAGMASAPEPQTGTVPYTGPALRDPNEAISIAPTGMPGSSPEMDAQIERFHAGNGTTPTQYGQGAPRAPLPGAVVGDAGEMRSKDAAVASALGIRPQAGPATVNPVAAALRGQSPSAPGAMESPRQAPADPWSGMRALDIAQANGVGVSSANAVQPGASGASPPAGAPDMRDLFAILSDPWAPPEQKAFVQSIFEQQMQRQQSAEQRAYEAAALRERRGYDAGLLRDERAYEDGVRREGFQREDGRNAVEDRREDTRLQMEVDKAIREGRQPINVGGVLVDPQTFQPVYQPPADAFTLNPGETRFDGAGNRIAAGGEKPGFRQATPQEAAGFGAAAGQFGPDGRFYPVDPPSNGITVGPDGTVQIGGSGQKLTEGQSKDLNYYIRGNASLETIEQHEAALADGGQRLANGVPIGGNYLTSTEFQLGNQAGREFLASILRKDTGAAITNEEFAIYGPMFLPQPGDSPQVIAQKRVSRKRALEAMKVGLGTATPLADTPVPQNPTVPGSDADPLGLR